jgi:hypothetical protein
MVTACQGVGEKLRRFTLKLRARRRKMRRVTAPFGDALDNEFDRRYEQPLI